MRLHTWLANPTRLLVWPGSATSVRVSNSKDYIKQGRPHTQSTVQGETFEGENFRESVGPGIFVEKTFGGLLVSPIIMYLHPQNSWRKPSRTTQKPRKMRTFFPSNVSQYMYGTLVYLVILCESCNYSHTVYLQLFPPDKHHVDPD